jgi:opacity protein-like surface antigen
MNSKTIVMLVIAALAPAAAIAQEASEQRTAAGGSQSQGPMIVERVHSGLLVAPDFKVTEVNGVTSELAGAYAGWITDDRFFIGGGGYWLANPNRNREMAYGGLVVQWLARANQRFGYSVKGLVGGGQATVSRSFSEIVPVRDPRDVRDIDRSLRTIDVRTRPNFFVAEPEADALIRLTRRLRLTVGAGYRFVALERGGGDNQLRGAVGTLGLQIGGGS